MNFSASLPPEAESDAPAPPKNVAIIMDGNGRWAKKRMLNRIKGQEKGAETVRTIVRASRKYGISILTLYAFSTENWQRSKIEVTALMTLLRQFLESERKEMVDNNIRLNAIGQIEKLPKNVQQALNQTMEATKHQNGMMLNLALSYGGRAEIVRMVQKLAKKCVYGEIDPATIASDLISDHLYTKGIPDPELLIRTSGEMRISNFLLWQIAYTEIFITETLWPDFGEEEFIHILKEYQRRERRFGRVDI
ncbi:MAG: isoprenyl transferase [Nitrospinales bacterium]